MAIGDLTFRLQSLSGDTPPIPEIVLSQRVAPGGYRRGITRRVGVASYADSGNPVVTVPGGDFKYNYTLTLILTHEEAEQLTAMESYQFYEHQVGGSTVPGTVRLVELVDEWQELRPEPSPHSRSLLATQTKSWGWVYGFGVVRGLLSLPEDSDFEHAGKSPILGCTQRVQVRFQEL